MVRDKTREQVRMRRVERVACWAARALTGRLGEAIGDLLVSIVTAKAAAVNRSAQYHMFDAIPQAGPILLPVVTDVRKGVRQGG